MSFLKGGLLHRKIAYVGLFAVLLLTFGPVVSQVQAMLLANNTASHMSHHKNMTHKTVDETTSQHTKQNQSSEQPASHHFMSLCGYCDLAHHSPIIAIYTPIIAQAPPLEGISAPLYLVDYRSPSYSKALSRAPPHINYC